jgi:hypothetical protein
VTPAGLGRWHRARPAPSGTRPKTPQLNLTLRYLIVYLTACMVTYR